MCRKLDMTLRPDSLTQWQSKNLVYLYDPGFDSQNYNKKLKKKTQQKLTKKKS